MGALDSACLVMRFPLKASFHLGREYLSGISPIELMVLPNAYSYFDSPALYGRDFLKFETIICTWISLEKQTVTELPVSLLYLSDFLPIKNEVQMKLIDDFIANVESAYNIKTEKLSIAEKWKATKPANVDVVSIQEYLQDVGVNSFCYGVYHELDWFWNEYQEKFDKAPYVNPVMQWRWKAAEDITKAQYDDAVNRLRIYKDWFLQEVMQVGKRNTLIVLPITSQEVDYRDVPPGPPTAPNAFDGIWLAPTLGAPEVSIPIGEMEYHSRVSGRQEHLPIVVSLLGIPGSDLSLLKTVRKVLEHSGRPLSVKAGSRMW
ncbi:hypothetical protein BU16DRAFT_201045 [Lophium mytilinum]|uniref:Amidase domain-containing protein n=1 Tax=Lophium mytilinum TaxID=390894 RepID=A0A6A6RAU4_9PEZI|nr:hypothetical protein BU16DRAFT_201045 [Lophium mytilinum]